MSRPTTALRDTELEDSKHFFATIFLHALVGRQQLYTDECGRIGHDHLAPRQLILSAVSALPSGVRPCGRERVNERRRYNARPSGLDNASMNDTSAAL